VKASIDVVVMTVIGGVSLLSGPIIGALFVIGVPAFVPLDSAGLAATQLGLLVIILYLPGGLAQLVQPLRDRIALRIAASRGIVVEPSAPEPTAGVAEALDTQTLALDPRHTTVVAKSAVHLNGSRPRQAPPLLEAHDLRVHFGGVRAVDGVSLSVRAGETVGLIGPNGAGKTTTFELVGGFTRADAGTVVFDRRDVTAMGPEARARLGLVRSFQDAALFPTMSVLECVMLALERTIPTSFLSSIAGSTVSERARRTRARELVHTMGLDRYRDRQIQELSTGTRRICELACVMALEPRMLLLDEPSSGIAQRETEALGALLIGLKEKLDLTLLVIEHDMPLIKGISDRIIAMADGKVIADGTAEAVTTDPRVVEAYLGGSVTAINRSGVAAEAPR
jgi:ABC-type branched-subunit amino acid transport system ATPase component